MSTHEVTPLESNLPVIHGDGITSQLFVRYICCYLLHDFNLDHANSCFYNNESERCRRAAAKVKEVPFSGRKQDQLTWAYNQMLSEDIEELISHNCKGNLSRAEYEVMLAEMIEDYNKWPKHV